MSIIPNPANVTNGELKVGSATAKCNQNCDGCLCNIYNLQFHFIDDDNVPYANIEYIAYFEDGSTKIGWTSINGYTEVFLKTKIEEIVVHLKIESTNQTKAEDMEKQKDTDTCTHTDGAIKVAEYIVEEIKRNVKSSEAILIRYWIDDDEYKKRCEEWENYPWLIKRVVPYPLQNNFYASIEWANKVRTKGDWDHKPLIRDNIEFKKVAVHRPLGLNADGAPSKSYYHKYKEHDYFYDVWSNIHYGYVGLSVGFSETRLLSGAAFEQWGGPDPIDDETAIKIGFKLFKKFGKFAEQLTAKDVLDALEATPDNQLPESRSIHWCWHPRNPKPKKNDGEEK